jgi:hypothetical protein
MPKTRLTLSLDATAIERARRYAEAHGSSVAELVSTFLSQLPLDTDDRMADLTPTVRRLLGVAKGDSGREEHRDHLLEKYGQ